MQSNSTHSVMGKTLTISLGGKKWQARKTTMGDLADFEGYLRGINVDNFLTIADKRKLPPELVASTIDKLYNAPWDPKTKMAHSQSVSGICFFLWCAMSKFDSSLTLERVSEMVEFDKLPEAMQALDVIQSEVEPPQQDSVPGADDTGNPTPVQHT